MTLTRQRWGSCAACGEERDSQFRFCRACRELVRAISVRGEWWQLAENGKELPWVFTRHGQCEDCGSWVRTTDSGEAEQTDPDGTMWRTAALELVKPEGKPPFYRCDCGCTYRIRWHVAGECWD